MAGAMVDPTAEESMPTIPASGWRPAWATYLSDELQDPDAAVIGAKNDN